MSLRALRYLALIPLLIPTMVRADEVGSHVDLICNAKDYKNKKLKKMLGFDDTRWKELEGGYRSRYDASIALRSIQDGIDVWGELWNELHHQGDVGLASYAAVPQLVRIAGSSKCRDWNFGLIATIEVERHRKSNPSIPKWLKPSYDNAWSKVSKIAVGDLNSNPDSLTMRAILSVLALAKGELKLGTLLSGMDTSEIDERLEERMAWSPPSSLWFAPDSILVERLCPQWGGNRRSMRDCIRPAADGQLCC